MWAGSAKDPLLAPIATSSVAAEHPKCAMPQTSEFAAADAAAAAVTIAPATEPTSKPVATSQVVFGMPQEMARALGWPQALTPDMAQDLFNEKVTWKSLGYPQWGTFRIASPDPNKTLVGAVGSEPSPRWPMAGSSSPRRRTMPIPAKAISLLCTLSSALRR
ncbi:hypothetical protein [Nostocoides veronense]|uniref:hypothetical protein n=1 Tax=Nostocoides veronense TaxID=330836 RepID=UPI0031CDB4C7